MNVFDPVKSEDRTAGTPYLSHSRISKYLVCPEQYRLYYMEKLRPKVPSAALVFGQVVHQSLAQLFDKGVDPVKTFGQTWDVLKNFKLRYTERHSWEKLKASGEGLLRKFASEELAKLKNITSVEKRFELNITGHSLPVVGVVDLVAAEFEGKWTLVDFKTSAASYSAHEVHMSDQLTAYQLAEPNAKQLALCVLVKTKEPKIEWHVTNRNSVQLSEYLAKAGYVASQIMGGHFYKRPGTWCSWCDFLPICLSQKAKAEATLVKV